VLLLGSLSMLLGAIARMRCIGARWSSCSGEVFASRDGDVMCDVYNTKEKALTYKPRNDAYQK
jgi:hypothetical protein